MVEGKLGRNVEHDPRSRAYGITAAAVPLRSVTHRRYGGIFDQGSLGSCVGNACAGALNTVPLHATGRTLKEADAVALYELATTLDDAPGSYPPDDIGSSGLAGAKAAQQRGLISSYQHAFGIDEALQALMAGPVITGTDWHESFDHPDARGLVAISGQVRGGHEFEVLGYDDTRKEVIAANSWGTSYGLRGRFRFAVATWAELLAAQGDVTILIR